MLVKNPPPAAGLNLSTLTDRIVDSYHQTEHLNYLNDCPLPRYGIIVEILNELREVIYPGFGRREGLNFENVRFHVGSLLERVHSGLASQIARAFMHENRRTLAETVEPTAREDFNQRGERIATQLIEGIPELRETLQADVEAAYDGDPAVSHHDEVVFCYPGLEAITVYRIANFLLRAGVPFIPRMMTEWAHKQTGIDIHPGATIGRRFFIDHGTGVVIGGTCQIGDCVKIYQGVTLGALSFPVDSDGALIRDRKRHPTIEDNVVIYANATILGGKTTIGHDSIIGSSVWITRSVAPRTTVVLEKPESRMRSNSPDPEYDFQI